MRTIAHTRLFVTLTLEEAAALVRLQPEPADTEAIRAVDKIRSTLERTIVDATRAEPSAAAVPPLRAKHYHRPEPLRMAKADLPVQVDTAAAAPERLRMHGEGRPAGEGDGARACTRGPARARLRAVPRRGGRGLHVTPTGLEPPPRVRLQRVDAWVIGRATVVAHAFQQWTGRTSFFLAKCGMALAGVSALVRVLDYWWPLLTDRTGVVTLVLFSAMVLAAARRAGHLEAADASVRDGRLALPMSVAVMREMAPVTRLLWLLFTIVTVPFALVAHVQSIHWLPEVVADLMLPGCCIAEYFVMVDPRPPGTSKVRAFLSSLRPRPMPQPVRR